MARAVRWLAVVTVVTFQAFLALSSQYLFAHIDPHPLDTQHVWIFNALIVCFWTSYFRSSFVDPGSPKHLPEAGSKEENHDADQSALRSCRKCNAPKPLRWHHCKNCQTCIPKMDHHCIWINNCVSHVTFPHFIRFLLYSVAGMSYLQYFLFIRFKVLWDHRKLPHVRCILCSISQPFASDDRSQYLGPTAPQLIHLFALGITNSMAVLFLSILLWNAIYSVFTNVYKIEGWEIERHEALVARARKSGGYVYGPGGVEVRIKRQEFPFDIGFWDNIVQGMGSANPLAWFWPFSRSPSVSTAMNWPVNDFEGEAPSRSHATAADAELDAPTTWPPPDPEKMSLNRALLDQTAPTNAPNYSNESEMEAFRRRQHEDIARKRQAYSAEPYDDAEDLDDEAPSSEADIDWKNSEGERLADFGVDESAEMMDEDNMPLSELIRRKKRP